MNTSQYLAHRIRELFLNGTWIANTNYKTCLETLPWQLALNKYPNNSIAELAQHVHYYLKGVMDVLKGGPLLVKDKYSFQFDEIKSQEQWETFLKLFWKDAEEFAQIIEQLSEEKLNETFVKKDYGSYQRNIDAIIEHAYYHLGQIALIKKCIEKENCE